MAGQRIVIIGGGFAGAYCARTLGRRLLPQQGQITLINKTNYFAFSPLLVEAGTGALEPRHAVVSLRRFAPKWSFRMAEVVNVDFQKQQVDCRNQLGDHTTVPYDQLVIALGSVISHPQVPGLERYAFGMKSLADAAALRDRAIAMLELADAVDDPQYRQALLRFVVVGANYTGVEVAGEFNAFLREALQHYPRLRRDDIQFILVDRNDRILNTLDRSLADYAMDRLENRGVQIELNNTVTKITPNEVELKTGQRLACHTVIWAAGIAPHPLIAKLDVPTDKRGYMLCQADLRVQGEQNVWGIGDAAVNPDPQGNAYPPTAQHAVREGQHAAKNLIRLIHGQQPKPLIYRSKGMMAPLGRRRAVASVKGFRLSGLPAWVLWRTYYLSKMPSAGRRLRITMDWTLDWFFKRDCVQLGVHGKDRPGQAAQGQPAAKDRGAGDSDSSASDSAQGRAA